MGPVVLVSTDVRLCPLWHASLYADANEGEGGGVMTQTTEDRLSPAERDRLATRPPAAARAYQKRRISPFWRHFVEMFAAMAVGMIATGAIFESIVGLKSWGQVTALYPTQALLAMAAGMSVPMVAWMLLRGMGWKNSYEMTIAMLLPVLPFLCLVWLNVTETAQCGLYCASTIVAMLAVMRYRRSEYSMHMKNLTRRA
jgi:hypothetical protein